MHSPMDTLLAFTQLVTGGLIVAGIGGLLAWDTWRKRRKP